MRKTRHWKLFRRRMLLEATMGCRYWRWHHWGCRLSNLSCRYHAVAPAIPCTLHLGPDIHRLLPASPISRLAFYIPIKLNELVQVIQKILSSGCPVVAWWKIISPPIKFLPLYFWWSSFLWLSWRPWWNFSHLQNIYRLQRLGQWPLFLIVLDAGTLNQGSCHLLEVIKNTDRWRYITFGPIVTTSFWSWRQNLYFFHWLLNSTYIKFSDKLFRLIFTHILSKVSFWALG